MVWILLALIIGVILGTLLGAMLRDEEHKIAAQRYLDKANKHRNKIQTPQIKTYFNKGEIKQ